MGVCRNSSLRKLEPGLTPALPFDRLSLPEPSVFELRRKVAMRAVTSVRVLLSFRRSISMAVTETESTTCA
jgi:hypothetical protein